MGLKCVSKTVKKSNLIEKNRKAKISSGHLNLVNKSLNFIKS